MSGNFIGLGFEFKLCSSADFIVSCTFSMLIFSSRWVDDKNIQGDIELINLEQMILGLTIGRSVECFTGD